MEKKFTTGTWIPCTVLGSYNFSVRTKERPELVIIPVNKTIVNLSIHEELEAEAKANALIIAAAPDLFKVCTDLLTAFIHIENDKKGNQARTNIFKYCPEFRDIATAARIAVSKAIQ